MSRTIARGTLVLAIQQVVAFGSMTLLHVATGRYFGPELYGLFSVAHAILSLLAFTFLSGVPQAVARFTAERSEAARAIARQGLLLQLAIGTLVAGGLFLGAGAASRWLGDSSLAPLLRLGALSLPFLGVTFLYVHSLNGLHRFGRQALALGAMNVFKVAAVIAFLLIGSGPLGAVRGLVLAAAAAALVAGLAARGLPGGEGFAMRDLARSGAQMSATIFAVAVWERVDLLMLGWLGSRPEDVGLFSAASTLTAAPASLLIPLVLTLLPAVSRASAAGAREDVARFVGQSIAWSYRFLCPLAIGAFVLADDLLGFFYGSEYLPAAFIIGPLVVGALFYALYEMLDTWLRGSGRANTSWRLAGMLLLGHVTLNLALIPRFELAGVVITTVVSAVAATVVTAVPAMRALGLRVGWIGAFRTAAAAVIAFAPLWFWNPGDGKESLAVAIPLLAVYVGLLFLFRELGPDDIRRARSLFLSPPGAAAHME